MRFLSLIRVQENTGKQPSERLMSEMGKLMGEMTEEAIFPRRELRRDTGFSGCIIRHVGSVTAIGRPRE